MLKKMIPSSKTNLVSDSVSVFARKLMITVMVARPAVTTITLAGLTRVALSSHSSHAWARDCRRLPGQR